MTGVALALSVLIGAIVVTACTCIPEQLLRIFTTSPEIIAEGKAYLGLLKWTFLLFMISNLLIAMLRSVETVKISFVISVVSLITNGCINYTLIFGHFGFPEMGIKELHRNTDSKDAGASDHRGIYMEDRYESQII